MLHYVIEVTPDELRELIDVNILLNQERYFYIHQLQHDAKQQQ
jgi:hypothetical protein